MPAPFQPVEVSVSKKVTLRWGYPDGHMEIIYHPPWPLSDMKFLLDTEDVKRGKDAFGLAVAWWEWHIRWKGKPDA
jgi:hypothetical protein